MTYQIFFSKISRTVHIFVLNIFQIERNMAEGGMRNKAEKMKEAKRGLMGRMISLARQINTQGWVDRYGPDALGWVLHRAEEIVDEIDHLNQELIILIPSRRLTAVIDARLPAMKPLIRGFASSCRACAWRFLHQKMSGNRQGATIG